jgi:hypothetical protein
MDQNKGKRFLLTDTLLAFATELLQLLEEPGEPELAA